MINWDPAAQTALSDEEVISKPQKGKLYFVRYEIVEEPGVFSKSQPRGRKRSWPTPRWLFIQATSDTSVSWANTHGVHSPARKFPSSPTKQSIRSSALAF